MILIELRWISRSVEPYVANNPANVGSDGPLAIVAKSQLPAQFRE